MEKFFFVNESQLKNLIKFPCIFSFEIGFFFSNINLCIGKYFLCKLSNALNLLIEQLR
jgi:hypothetical protein